MPAAVVWSALGVSTAVFVAVVGWHRQARPGVLRLLAVVGVVALVPFLMLSLYLSVYPLVALLGLPGFLVLLAAVRDPSLLRDTLARRIACSALVLGGILYVTQGVQLTH